jgi:cytoskeletal protein RodZ
VFEIGNTLREARQRQDLDFPEIELGTKIRAKYLRALEDEQFDVLPSPTYVKGFLRTYAEYLGLDGQLYLDEYNSRFFVANAPEEDSPRPRRSHARPRRERRLERNAVLLAIVGIAVVTALVFAAWQFGSGSSPSIPNLKKAKPTAARVPKTTQLIVRALRGSSLVLARLGSETGRSVFPKGLLDAGETHRFTAKRLWLSIGTPENVELKLDGGQWHKVGTTKPCSLIVASHRLGPARPDSC